MWDSDPPTTADETRLNGEIDPASQDQQYKSQDLQSKSQEGTENQPPSPQKRSKTGHGNVSARKKELSGKEIAGYNVKREMQVLTERKPVEGQLNLLLLFILFCSA